MSAQPLGELYRRIWNEDPRYGTAEEWVRDTVEHRIAPFMARHHIQARVVADFGAGDGRYLVEMQRQGLCFFGIGIDYHEPATLPRGITWLPVDMAASYVVRADFAISCDALEHVPKNDIDIVLTNMRLAADNGWARISLIDDTYGTERGLHLHETLLPAHEWLVRFRRSAMAPLEYRVYLDTDGRERALELGW